MAKQCFHGVPSSSGRRSMSLVELLVVVAIIAVLFGLILVGLSAVRHRRNVAATSGTMRSFLGACETFRLEHGFNPGLIPESVLGFHNHQMSHGVNGACISSTENALLHLMGGYVEKDRTSPNVYDALDPAEGWVEYEIMTPTSVHYFFKFNRNRMGDGPTIDGQSYPPYFTPRADEIMVLDRQGPGAVLQWTGDGTWNEESSLPDLVDAWGQPIIYLRRMREHGPLVAEAHDFGRRPQFYIDSIWPYICAPGQAWLNPCSGGDGLGSILSYGPHGNGPGQDAWQPVKGLAHIIRHPSSGDIDPVEPSLLGTPLGSVILISAGADGIYFSAADGPGSLTRNIGCMGCGGFQPYPYEEFLQEGRQSLAQFDDLVMAGGG
jgi:type II secretory pathway pseudopilin PulG